MKNLSVIFLLILSCFIGVNKIHGQNKLDSIIQIQQVLKDLGYDPGTADGIAGAKTINAIKKFQTENNIESNGAMTKETFDLLFPVEIEAIPEEPVREPTLLDKPLEIKILIILACFIITQLLVMLRNRK